VLAHSPLSHRGVCVTAPVCVSFRGIPQPRDDEESRTALESTQSEIPRSARNDSIGRVVKRTPLRKRGEAVVSPNKKVRG